VTWWLLTGGLGLLFVVGGLVFVRSGLRLSRAREPVGWHVVPGTIVDWEWIRIGGDGAKTPFPVVEYSLPDGRPHRFRSHTTANMHILRRGRPVTLYVDPADPTRAQLSSAARTLRKIGLGHQLVGGFIATAGALVLAGTAVVAWLLR